MQNSNVFDFDKSNNEVKQLSRNTLQTKLHELNFKQVVSNEDQKKDKKSSILSGALILTFNPWPSNINQPNVQ